MNVGISVPLPAYLVDVGFMARKVEELGFESFWCAEHPFIPVHSASRFPGSADGVIPESYSHFIDPFVALARASGVTSRIKLGTGIVLVPERHPAAPRQGDLHPRSLQRRAFPVRHRRGLAPRRDRRSWAATSTTAGRRRASRSWP